MQQVGHELGQHPDGAEQADQRGAPPEIQVGPSTAQPRSDLAGVAGDCLPVAEVALGRVEGRDDRLLSEAERGFVELAGEGAVEFTLDQEGTYPS